jgi:hypothetical protein
LLWREGGQTRYSRYIPTLPEAIRAKEQKELYLAGLANGLKVEDPTEGKIRLTVDAAVDEFLNGLTGRGNTVPTCTQNLRQFQHWNSSIATAKKTFLDQIDRPHIMAFKTYLESDPTIQNGQYTAAWNCIRVNNNDQNDAKAATGAGVCEEVGFLGCPQPQAHRHYLSHGRAQHVSCSL